MLQIRPNARATPAVRAEIARSGEPTGALARRYGVSTETIRPRPSASGAGAARRIAGTARPGRTACPGGEGDGGGTGRGLRPAALRRLRARRPHLRGRPLPAAPEPRRRLAHPEGGGAEPAGG